MDMSKYRPESHVAQQSLRDKLRVQQNSNLLHQLENFPNSLEHVNPDFVQVQNVRNDNLVYDPDVFSTGIFHVLPQSSVESQQNCDWMMGYASGLAGRENNQDLRVVAEVMSDNARETNISAATQCLKPSYSAVNDAQSAQSNPGTEVYSLEGKRDYGNLHFVSPSLYQNALQDDVGLEVGSHENRSVRESARDSRMYYFVNEANPVQFGNADSWMNRSLVGASDATTHQGLSLSLSSNPTSKFCGVDAVQFTDGQHGESKELQESKALNLGRFCSIEKTSVTGKASRQSFQETGGTSTSVHQQMIPLGPFTGYATILKNSRFLKPAQDLLDGFFQLNNSKSVKARDTSEGISGASGSSSTFYCSNESSRSEYQQKKAKFVYMQEEVCRRYKLYHQQMQMVVSSFESVAGLGAATPYFSLALKTVARNFRCLRNAVLDQIRHISRALGEDLLSSTTGTSSNKGDMNMSRLKYAGYKSGGVNMVFLEPQLGWRPQRGLPERSVSILRAWLFEHFLHPYPTDTDKHMLAAQTGLSRNQVSNWFINARVRVWKPMVEEIHMLESKGLAEGNLNLSRSDGKSTSERLSSWPNEDQSINWSCVSALSDEHLACSDMLVDVEPWNHEKRSRMDFHIPSSMESSLMNFAPCQQSRLENGGIGAVSLTLGLRNGVESVQQQQQQQQQYHQQQEHHLIRDFVG